MSLPVPQFRDFHDCIWSGAVNLATPQARLDYGKVHLNQLLENLQTTQLKDSLRIVADRHAIATD